MATAKIENAVPHVYTGIAEVLKSLSVAKGGTLPGNMGGKPYITAVDAAAETKRQFVANNLVFFPNEKVVKHDVIQFKDRLNIVVVIEGSYRIVSTVDGSSETVSGVGDGLATGTAVASNIASTNALKNALLRTFLITEQSVEDAAKNESDSGAAGGAHRKIDGARTSPARTATSAPQNTLKQRIQDEFVNNPKSNATMDTVKEIQEAVLKGTPELKGDDLFQAILDGLKAAEAS